MTFYYCIIKENPNPPFVLVFMHNLWFRCLHFTMNSVKHILLFSFHTQWRCSVLIKKDQTFTCRKKSNVTFLYLKYTMLTFTWSLLSKITEENIRLYQRGEICANDNQIVNYLLLLPDNERKYVFHFLFSCDFLHVYAKRNTIPFNILNIFFWFTSNIQMNLN